MKGKMLVWGGTRTHDPSVTRQGLYLLSYPGGVFLSVETSHYTPPSHNILNSGTTRLSWRSLVCNPVLPALGAQLFTKSNTSKMNRRGKKTARGATQTNEPITVVRCPTCWTVQMVLFSPCTKATPLNLQYKNTYRTLLPQNIVFPHHSSLEWLACTIGCSCKDD